jgi:hypothetical protein
VTSARIDDVQPVLGRDALFDSGDPAVQDADIGASAQLPRRIQNLSVPDQDVVPAGR